jgi:hypothetical protein
MFDLDQAVAEWRQQMLAAGIQSPVPLEELEVHLREDIERLMKSGRSEAEAFEAAILEIGQARAVQGEFKKINPAKDAFEWKLMEISLGIGASVLPLLLCSEIFHFKTGSFVDLTPSQQISGVVAVVIFALFAWSGRLCYKVFPVIQSKRTRGVVTIFCVSPVILWWIIFMNFIAPRHDFTMGQFGVAFLWAFVAPAGPMIGFTWGIEAAVWKRIATSTS